MRYLPSLNLVFIHIQRTGGSSVSRMIDRTFGREHDDVRSYSTRAVRLYRHRLEGGPGMHVNHDQLRGYYPEVASADCFTFVRHPVDWYVSVWKYFCYKALRRRRKGEFGRLGEMLPPEPRYIPMRYLLRFATYDCREFILAVCREMPGFYGDMCRGYCDKAAFVGRTESLAEDLSTILTRSVKETRINRARWSHPKVSDEVIAAVMESEADMASKYYGPATTAYRWKKDWE